MAANKKLIDRLTKHWLKADKAWKAATKKYQAASAKYHWTAADDGFKWKQVIALRDREMVAFEKAEAAYDALMAATRSALLRG